MALIIGILVFIIFLPLSFYVVGWFVRKYANRMVPSDKKDLDGSPIMIAKPIFWYFQPENTTAYLQRKGNDASSTGGGSKATPGSGSAILDVTHAVPGKFLEKTDTDRKKWKFRNCTPADNEDAHKGLFYHLYGVHYLGIFMELRTVRVREVRLSVDEEKTKAYKQAQAEWDKGPKTTPTPKPPSYEENVKDYETLFPFYSREHDIAIRNSETAGSFTLDLYTKTIYEETYPVRARIEVADPNATLSTLVEQSINGETGSREPEYYLFENIEGKLGLPTLKERRKALITSVKTDVATEAEAAIGITLKNLILYSVDVDKETQTLLELKERTEREANAEILRTQKQIEVAKNEAKKAVKIEKGNYKVNLLKNKAAADHVATVTKPLAELPNGPAIRFAEALEQLEGLTHLTFAPGKESMLPLGQENS